jgi:hypothetical protein
MFLRFQSDSNLVRRLRYFYYRCRYLCLIGALIVTAACQSGSADPNDPKVHARKLMQESGRDSAKITNVVSGDKKYRQADELWCVATDLTSPDGQVPYLLAVWRKGGKWEGAELTEGYYEWELHGCPH